jgi:cardiolipin synthase A/B
VPGAAPQQVFVGAQAFVDALRADLATCDRTLRVQFSTFEGDTAGEAFAELLLDRVRAGVSVQMILDGYSEVIADDVYPFSIRGRKTLTAERRRTADLLAKLESSGVAIKRVAPAGRMHRYILFRDHKKMVLLDDRVAYLGGLNVSEHNYGWHDFMVRIGSAAVADLVTDFTTTWAGHTQPLTEVRDDRDFALNQGPGRQTVLAQALRSIGDARERIAIESPYLCGDRIESALLDAARRGVRVSVVSPYRPNHLHNKVWIRKLRRRLRHPNIDLFGYRGSTEGMTHAKLLVVDGRVAMFGSINFQEIEALAQKELNVVTRDPALLAELSALHAADVAASEPAPRPRTAFGWWTYRFLYGVVRWWTRRLLRRESWRAVYT